MVILMLKDVMESNIAVIIRQLQVIPPLCPLLFLGSLEYSVTISMLGNPRHLAGVFI